MSLPLSDPEIAGLRMRLGHRAVQGAFGPEVQSCSRGRRTEQGASYRHLQASARRDGEEIRFPLYRLRAFHVDRDRIKVAKLRMRLASDDRPDKLRQILDGLRHQSPRSTPSFPSSAARQAHS